MNSWNKLRAGMFIRFHCRTTKPQKPKFALVVAVETQCAIALLINSEPSEFILSKPDSSAHVFNEEDIATVQHVADSSAALRNHVAQIVHASRTLNRRTKTAVGRAFGTPNAPEDGC